MKLLDFIVLSVHVYEHLKERLGYKSCQKALLYPCLYVYKHVVLVITIVKPNIHTVILCLYRPTW